MMFHGRLFIGFLTLAALGAVVPGVANAYPLSLPPSLPQETLSESVPTALAPSDELAAADFSVEWVGAPIPGVRIELGRESLQWVRVAEVLVLPRGRLLVAADGVDGGRVSNAGFSQPFIAAPGTRASAELPIALLSGDANPIEVVVRRGQRELAGKLRVRFRPRASTPRARVYIDPSCSRFGVSAAPGGSQPGKWRDEWAYVGCRLSLVEGAEHRTPSLEMFVYWDGAGQRVAVGGAGTPASGVSTWALRLAANARSAHLDAGDHDLTLSYALADPMRLGSLGLGLGPYVNTLVDNNATETTFTPTVMLYGSYFVNEGLRLVAFDAFGIGRHGTMDSGFYLNTENIRLLDRRLAVNIMLGVHAIGFAYADQYLVKPGFPQGVELIYTDAFKPGYNLSLGGFFYPNINGEAYTNVWIRWGSRVFVEFNYIGWEERALDMPLHNHTAGISIGFPIARFF